MILLPFIIISHIHTYAHEEMLFLIVAVTHTLAISVLAILIVSGLLHSWNAMHNKPITIINYQSDKARVDDRDEALRRFICHDEDIASIIQREQWLRAHMEVFGHGFLAMNDKDMNFYREGYGALDVSLMNNPKNLSSLVYYRIYKVGNDNIRALLYEYAFNRSGEMDRFASSGCPADHCIHPNVTRLGMGKLPKMLFSSTDRFVFTFVRHPIARFISAMNEIESRAYADKNKLGILPLHAKIGTVERVMEFINMILMSGGSGSLFRMYDGVELAHIAPMMGTIFLARSTEKSPLRMFKIEDFGSEWRRLSRVAAVPELERIFWERKKQQNWLIHASAKDPLEVTRIASSFFAIAGVDLLEK